MIQPGIGTIRRPRAVTNSVQNYVLVVGALFFLVLLNWTSVSELLFANSTLMGRQKQSEIDVIPKTSSRGSSNSNAENENKASPITNARTGFKYVTEQGRFYTSAAHCSLSTMNDKAWEGAMCSFKNLCFDPKNKDFVFFRAIPEVAPPPHEVNLGKGTKFMPRIVDGKLPVPRFEAGDDETWIIMEMIRDGTQKLEDFLRDDLFAWWLLGQHSTWADQRTVMRPLATPQGAPMTVDMEQWYAAMPLAPLTDTTALANAHAGEDNTVICFPRSVVGLGSMTDHCLAKDHEYREQKRPGLGIAVESIPCATGRGPLFYRLREEMISRLTSKINVSLDDAKRSIKDPHVILFAEAKNGEDFTKAEQEAKSKFSDHVVRRECVSCLSPFEQLQLALTVSVFVTRPTGPQSLAAHLLRRGAGVVLMEQPPYAHTNFGLWNNLAYIRARWVQNSDLLMDAIDIELQKCDHFM